MKYCEKPELTELGNQLSGNVADTFVNVGIELYTTKLASSDKRLIRTLDQQLSEQTAVLDNSATDSYPELPQLLSPPMSKYGLQVPALSSDSNFSTHPSVAYSASNNVSSVNGAIPTAVAQQYPAMPGIASINGDLVTAIPNSASLATSNSSGIAFGGVSKRRAQSTPAGSIGSPFGPLAEVGNMKQYAYLIAVLNASDPDRDFSALQPSSFQRIYSDLLNPLHQTILSLGVKPPANLWSALEEELTLSECKAYALELPQQFLEDDDTGISWSKMFFFFNKRRKRVLFVYLNTRPASYPRESSSDSEGVLGELE